ncbi:MAG: DUF4175 domain-containing protein, partial [Pseudomonadota bacterium]
TGADDALRWLPVPFAAAALAWRFAGFWPAALLLVVTVAAFGVFARHRATRFDRAWLIRELDSHAPGLEDSADLLFVDTPLGPLQRLQQARIGDRLTLAPIDLRPAWSSRAILLAWLIAAAVVIAAFVWPRGELAPGALAPSDEAGPVVAGVPRLTGQRLRIIPPGYTGLPARDQGALDAKVPAGSRLVWTLQFVPDPAAAALAVLGSGNVALAHAGDRWTAATTARASVLYRVVPQGGAGTPRLRRIDVVPDAPPRVRQLSPTQTLTLVTAGQRSWDPVFEANDDYGVAATARLRVVVTEGDGENITFRERTLSVRGSGSATRKRFAANLPFAAFGMARGGDMVVTLSVADNRSPGPQIVRGPSAILRWPPERGLEGTGLEGALKPVLPAYFRSQRQIIIDAEALIKQRRRITPDAFLVRSDTLGVDQRLLRLRYGQFAGEAAEGGPKPPTNDADAGLTADAAPAPEAHPDHDGHTDGDKSPAFGRAGGELEEYGHTHDESEAATLLDPDTRVTLRLALDQMWQSELNLRQGMPDKALPFAYKALRYIKQIQQASRIYLRRTGTQQPAIDQARRLTGKRDGIARRALAPATPAEIDAAPAAVWRALAAPGPVALDSLERWLRGNRGRVADPLAFAGAIDAVRREPGCTRCRAALRGLVWSALARPAPTPARRSRGDAAGARYLDAIRP